MRRFAARFQKIRELFAGISPLFLPHSSRVTDTIFSILPALSANSLTIRRG
jgi:hypothetical protein